MLTTLTNSLYDIKDAFDFYNPSVTSHNLKSYKKINRPTMALHSGLQLEQGLHKLFAAIHTYRTSILKHPL